MSCVYVLQRGHCGDGSDLVSTLCKYVSVIRGRVIYLF